MTMSRIVLAAVFALATAQVALGLCTPTERNIQGTAGGTTYRVGRGTAGEFCFSATNNNINTNGWFAFGPGSSMSGDNRIVNNKADNVAQPPLAYNIGGRTPPFATAGTPFNNATQDTNNNDGLSATYDVAGWPTTGQQDFVYANNQNSQYPAKHGTEGPVCIDFDELTFKTASCEDNSSGASAIALSASLLAVGTFAVFL